MRRTVTTLGGLRCELIDGADGGPPDLLVVLCHGYGAPGDDLVPLGPELLAHLPGAAKVRFVFPEAPLDLEELGMPGGRAWWPIDMERLMALQYDPARGLELLQQEAPPEVPRARRLLLSALDEALRQAGLGWSKVVLGGFSQGAMLATDVALRLEEPPAALAILSGTLVQRAEWEKRAPARAGLEVLQSHGRADPLLPFANAAALRELLSSAGLKVDFVPFHGGHTIPYDVLDKLAKLLGRHLPAR